MVESSDELHFDFTVLKAELRDQLQSLKNEENTLKGDIRAELARAEENMGSNFSQLFDRADARLSAGLEMVSLDARQLSQNLALLSTAAENISERVSILDLNKSRVVECLQRTNDLRDLRTCAEGVEKALKEQDYEEAAQSIHRFLTLDSVILKMGDQLDTKDLGYSVKNNYDVLRKASGELKAIIERKFDDAFKAADEASMQRFFKLYPLINEHSAGVQRFGRFLCSKVEAIGNEQLKIMEAGGTDDKRMNILFADTLMLILEGVARTIELHQPLVENSYGLNNLVDLIEIVQAECDRQAIRVVTAFIGRRQFELKVKEVERNMLNIRHHLAVAEYGVTNLSKSASTGDLEKTRKVDALELDMLLYEVVLMHTHVELYWRFFNRRIAKARVERQQSDLPEMLAEEQFESEDQRKERQAALKAQTEERRRKLAAVVGRSALNVKIQELLGKYVLLEQYYMTESVKKAIEMDAVEEGSLTSSLLDDVFFIVRKCVRRSVSSSSVDCVCATINNAITLLETDYLRVVNTPIKDSSQRGGIPFVVALNNIRGTNECARTLKTALNIDIDKHFAQASAVERTKIEHSIGQFDDFCRRLEHHLSLGITKFCETTFRQAIKRSFDGMLDISHVLTEEQLADFEQNDPFIESVIDSLDKQIAPLATDLTPENHQLMLNSVCAEVSVQFEKVIFKCAFNRLGGLQLDKEYRQLVNYMTGVAGWLVREKCARLSQIVALLNSETDEVGDYVRQLKSGDFQPSGVVAGAGALSDRDIRRVLALRTDISRETVTAALR